MIIYLVVTQTAKSVRGSFCFEKLPGAMFNGKTDNGIQSENYHQCVIRRENITKWYIYVKSNAIAIDRELSQIFQTTTTTTKKTLILTRRREDVPLRECVSSPATVYNIIIMDVYTFVGVQKKIKHDIPKLLYHYRVVMCLLSTHVLYLVRAV